MDNPLNQKLKLKNKIITEEEKIERLNSISKLIIELKVGEQTVQTKGMIQSLQQEFDRVLKYNINNNV